MLFRWTSGFKQLNKRMKFRNGTHDRWRSAHHNGNTPSPSIDLPSTLRTSHISSGARDLTALCLYVITFWILFCSQKSLKQTTAFLWCWDPRLVLTFIAARKEWVARQRQRLSGYMRTRVRFTLQCDKLLVSLLPAVTGSASNDWMMMNNEPERGGRGRF